MKVWSGSAWVEKPTKVWSGSAWVTKPVKVWNGTQWVVKPPSGGGPSLPVFRSSAVITYTTRSGSTSVDAPAGLTNGDIILVVFFAGTGGGSGNLPGIDITPATGFTQIGSASTMTDGGGTGFNGKLFAYWKRASSEPTGWFFSHTGSLSDLSTENCCVAYSSCIASGSPIDVFSLSQQNSGGPATYASVTTTLANDKLVLMANNWDASGTLSPPTGMTERYDHLVYVADEDRPTAGATGTRSHTLVSTINPWSGYLIALKGA